MSTAVVLDAAQQAAALKLDALARALNQSNGRLWRLFHRRSFPRGIYLWGAVGRGKTMLMDRLFERAEIAPKRRIHFNAFMTEAHARIHEWRTLGDSGRTPRRDGVHDLGGDPITPTARRFASQARFLCLDEFQVRDVADAMVLGRLFEQLLACGTVVVATSNTSPRQLYEGGINRQLFLPFIALIEERLDVVELAGSRDWRLGRMAGHNLYVTPLGARADAALDGIWAELTDGADARPDHIEILGRSLRVPQAAHGVARFSFQEICENPLAAADYLALARRYHVLMIDGVPLLGPDRHDAARRFTVLIDTLYDENIVLACSAAAPPSALYCGSDPHSFRRTASRLVEMQSSDYLGRSGAAAT